MNKVSYLTEHNGKPSASRLTAGSGAALGFLLILLDAFVRAYAGITGAIEVVDVARFDVLILLFGLSGGQWLRTVFASKYKNGSDK